MTALKSFVKMAVLLRDGVLLAVLAAWRRSGSGGSSTARDFQTERAAGKPSGVRNWLLSHGEVVTDLFGDPGAVGR